MPTKTILSRSAVFYFRLFLGLVLVMSSLGKLADIKGFAVLVSDYHLLPNFLVLPFSYLIPWTEFTCGLLLLFGFRLQIIGTITTALIGIFTVAVGISLIRKLDIDCGCFDIPIPIFGPAKIGWHTVIRNVIFLAMALSLIFINPKKDLEKSS